jgi:hypothetical protein
MQRLFKYIEQLINRKFYGILKISFQAGHIKNIEKIEVLKPEEL